VTINKIPEMFGLTTAPEAAGISGHRPSVKLCAGAKKKRRKKHFIWHINPHYGE
jgi:hypothetical protein